LQVAVYSLSKCGTTPTCAIIDAIAHAAPCATVRVADTTDLLRAQESDAKVKEAKKALQSRIGMRSSKKKYSTTRTSETAITVSNDVTTDDKTDVELAPPSQPLAISQAQPLNTSDTALSIDTALAISDTALAVSDKKVAFASSSSMGASETSVAEQTVDNLLAEIALIKAAIDAKDEDDPNDEFRAELQEQLKSRQEAYRAAMLAMRV